MDYATVLISGKQEIVSLGQILEVAKIEGIIGDKLKFDKVLLYRTDAQTQVGQPFLTNFFIEAEIIEQFKGKKIDVRKFKQKVRYRRKMGFRPLMTKVKIVSIGGISSEVKKAGVKKSVTKKVASTKKKAK